MILEHQGLTGISGVGEVVIDTLLGVGGRRVWGQQGRGGAGILKAEVALELEERKAFWHPCLF